MVKIQVLNLGCKVNQCECDAIIRELSELGYSVTSELSYADIFVLNTCAVTGEAERKSRNCVSKCMKINTNSSIFVVGCASQSNSQQFIEKDNVVYINGARNKAELASVIDDYVKNNRKDKIVKCDNIAEYQECSVGACRRARYYVKIQDGCNNYCSYCLVPYLRGVSRSRKAENVLLECESAMSLTKEIVLTGINLSAYGEDINSSLAELLTRLVGIDCAIRLGSLEVNVITDEFLSATKELKCFCPHFHLSLQSASDRVLSDMNRKYTIAEYIQKVEKIRAYYPMAAITTDIIVGFPTETDEAFGEGLKNIKRIHFADAHVFPYSKRKGTVAEKYSQINGKIIEERIAILHEIVTTSKADYLSSHVGKRLFVIAEQIENGTGVDEHFGGYSENYIRTIFVGDNIKIGEKHLVEATSTDGKVLFGYVVDNKKQY